MKILKYVIIALVFIVALYFAISAFLPSSYLVTRDINIAAPMDVVFNQVNDFNQMQNWSPWKDYDTTMKITVSGRISEAGYKYSWKSTNKQLGNGSITRKTTVLGKSITNDLMLDDYGMHSNDLWKFEQTPDGVKVTWGNSSEVPIMSRVFFAISSPDKMMGPDFEKGLKRLKSFCEENKTSDISPANNIKVEEVKYEKQNYLAIHSRADVSSMGKIFGERYAQMNAEIVKQKLKVTGQPFAIYFSDSAHVVFDFEAAIPVNAVAKDNKKIMAGSLTGGNAIVAHYYGAYEGIGKAHTLIQKFIKDNNKKMIGPVWEVYVTDPTTVKNPLEILTNIYYGVE